MGTIPPVLDLWMEKETGRMLIGSYALNAEYGFPEGVGDLRAVDTQEFLATGLDIILEDLQGFAERRIGENVFEGMTEREVRAFHRKHRFVLVRMDSPKKLVICPMVRRPGGHMGKDEEAAKFDVSLGNEKFYQVVMQMFDKCE